MPALTADQKKWQVQDDAWALINYEKVIADKGRLKLAKTEVKRMQKEKEAELMALKKIAKQK